MIVERIQQSLESGQLKPGSKLPPERELAANLGISRSSLREALKALTVMGVLESRVADGTYVRSQASSSIAESLQFSILLRNRTSLFELMQARKVIEPELVRLATPIISEAQIQRLEREVSFLGSTIRTVDLFNEHDTVFHLLIAEAAGNDLLYALAKLLQNLAVAARQKTAYRYDLSRSFQEHSEIVAQIKARNPEGGVKAMLEHLNGALSVSEASDFVEVGQHENRTTQIISTDKDLNIRSTQLPKE
jgi:DNA-binding FadR family transcriptional regulator